MRTVRLGVTLREVTPTVLRVLDVPAACTLPELHDLLQIAIGWTDSHLHQFVVPAAVSGDVGEVRYGLPDAELDRDEHDETGVRLTELPPRFRYLYDFGDGWDHDIEVLGPGEPEPGCRYGEGRCPPEDCGGATGYAELLQVLADPTHDDHEQMVAWVGEWPEFDQPSTDRLVRDMVGQVPPSVALLLELIGDGVRLTPGGRLPRALVRQMQQQRPDWYPLGLPAQLEEDLPPLAALHGLLRRVGLLRLSKGVLHRTRAAGDPLEVVRRLRRAFPRREFHSLLAGDLVAMLATRSPASRLWNSRQIRARHSRRAPSSGSPRHGCGPAPLLDSAAGPRDAARPCSAAGAAGLPRLRGRPSGTSPAAAAHLSHPQRRTSTRGEPGPVTN